MKKEIKKEELFDLDYTLVEFILPRLAAFRKLKRTSYPSSFKSLKEWNSAIDEMIYGMKYVLKKGLARYKFKPMLKIDKRAENGLVIFAKNLLSLWD